MIEKLKIVDVAYMAHPVSGDVLANLALAKRWVRWLEECHCPNTAIVAPWITECEIWDDSDPQQRADGMARDISILRRCDRLIAVGGQLTEGMHTEIAHAREVSMPVEYLISMGKEPPAIAPPDAISCNFCAAGVMKVIEAEVVSQNSGVLSVTRKYLCINCGATATSRQG